MSCGTSAKWIENLGNSILLRLDSAHTTSLEQDTYTFNLQGVHALHNARRVVLYTANIFNLQPVINSNNNRLIVEELGVFYNVIVPEGNYDSATFLTALNVALGAVGFAGALTASYVDPANPLVLQFTSTLGGFILHTDEKFINGVESTLADYIGVYNDLIVPIGGTTPATGVIDLSGLNQVFIESDELYRGHLYSTDADLQHGGQVKNWGSGIPITSDYGFRTVYQPNSQEMSAINYPLPRDLRRVSIRLIDSKSGKPIKNSNAPWECVLRIYS